MSGELIIKDKTIVDGTDVFALPPAALSPSKMEATSRLEILEEAAGKKVDNGGQERVENKRKKKQMQRN